MVSFCQILFLKKKKKKKKQTTNLMWTNEEKKLFIELPSFKSTRNTLRNLTNVLGAFHSLSVHDVFQQLCFNSPCLFIVLHCPLIVFVVGMKSAMHAL